MSKKNIRHLLIVAGLLATILAVYFYDVTFQGKTFKATTMFAQSMPYGVYGQAGNHEASCHTFLRETALIEEPFYEFLKINFQKGIFPLWNPYQFCGTPMSFMLEAGVLFPLTAVMYFLPNSISLDLLILLRLLVAGLLMYWLMKVWRFHFISRMAAALTFTLTGPMVTCHLWFINVDLLLPLLFLSAYKSHLSNFRKHYLLFSMAIALSIFAGHIEHIFLTHFFLLLYVLFLFFRKRKDREPARITLAKNFVIFYILGIGISAIVFFPFLGDFHHGWTGHTSECGLFAHSFSQWISKLITVIIPTFFTKDLVSLSGHHHNWGGGYLGVIVLLTCLIGLCWKKQRRFVWFFMVAAVLTYGMASASVYTKWLGYLPIFNIMLLGLHTLYIFIFVIAVLVGVGIEKIIINPKKSLEKALWIIFGVIIFIAIYLWAYRDADFFNQAFQSSAISFCFLACVVFWVMMWMFISKKRGEVIAGGILALLVVELFVHNPHCRPARFDSFPRVPYIEFLKKRTENPAFRAQGLFLTFFGNTAMAYGVESFSGKQAILPRRYAEFVGKLISPHLFPKICPKAVSAEGFEEALLSNSDFLAVANVNYFVLPEKANAGEEAVYRGEAKIVPLSSIIAIPSAVPRAYLAYSWIVKEKGKKEEILNLIKEKRMGVVPEVVIEASLGDIIPQPQGFMQKGIAPIREEERWANGVKLTASTSKQCILVLLDTYHPGWKAWVDGRSAKVFPVNYLFRGVFLSPGEHVVEFRFIPFWFYFGFGVTILSFAGWFYLLLKRVK